jgi:hypothetical protein
VRDTLNVILKYEGDIKKAHAELGRLIARKAEDEAAKPGAGPGAAPAAAPAKKGALH